VAGAIVCATLLALVPGTLRGAENTNAALFLLARFPGQPDTQLTSYIALRHLEAATRSGSMRASANVLITVDPLAGFKYRFVNEEGNDNIRRRVFHAVLDAEQQRSRDGADDELLSPANYYFEDDGRADGSLLRVRLTPKHEDPMLVDGAMFVKPDDGDVVRVEGRLSKRPSFWTRRVDVVHRFARLAGVRVPIAFDSVAKVLFVGESVFTMRWQYESINGVHIGSPSRPLLQRVADDRP
jgi:hypothetical protein